MVRLLNEKYLTLMKNSSLSLKTSIGLRVFYFRPISLVEGMQFQVTVFALFTNHYFTMIISSGQWVFKSPHLVQHFVLEVEDKLREHIVSSAS